MARKKLEHTECQNDHTKLVGAYCHTCGQRADDPRRVVIGLVQDFLVDTLAIDGKLARSIWLLLSRPGVLARRYLDGRRVHYSPPFRLFLFTSVFFFLTFFMVTDFTKSAMPPIAVDSTPISEEMLRELELRNPDAAEELRALVEDLEHNENPEELNERDISGGKLEDESRSRTFSDVTWEDVNYGGPAQLEPFVKQMFEAAQRASRDPRLFFAQIRETLPRTLLLAPVLYAVILSVLYFYRRKFYIYDHFVIALYLHAALYAYLLSALLISRAPAIGSLAFFPLVWGFFQPLLALRQAYNSGWLSSTLKWLVTMTIYLTGVSLLITFGVTYSLYQS
jgi:hypothetical protein